MDLTKLMKGPAETEPVQEQPKLSREEYAAQKKAEREELWTRIDALTVDVFKDGSSLRGFLDFTAQCSPERIENLLLFHSDAPEATWLKTFDERHTVRRATVRRMWPQRNTVWTSVPFPSTVCAKCAPVWSRRSRGAF